MRRGQAVFNGTKAACSSCHAIGYLGGKVGPDLTQIGKIRTERDLLESIVFPSASFVRSYEPVQVTTKSGKMYNGLVRQDTSDEIVLATGVNQEARIARDDIEEIQPSKVSVMPAGLDQQLTVRELAEKLRFNSTGTRDFAAAGRYSSRSAFGPFLSPVKKIVICRRIALPSNAEPLFSKTSNFIEAGRNVL